MYRSCIVLSIALLAGCGGRSASVVPDSGVTPDHGVTVDSGGTGSDTLLPDKGLKKDAPGDLPVKPDLTKTLTHCVGAARVNASGVDLKVDKIATSMNYVASCCPPGEVLAFKTITPKGQPVEVSLQVARFPNTKLPPHIKIDLAKPPTGWYVAIYCNPSSFCGNAHSTSHAFTGHLEISSMLGSPSVQVTACVAAKPLDTTNPYKHPIKLWASKVLVNKVCVPKMDQTCNYDPMISSLRGKCNDDSTCTCNPGSTKMVNGKCK